MNIVLTGEDIDPAIRTPVDSPRSVLNVGQLWVAQKEHLAEISFYGRSHTNLSRITSLQTNGKITTRYAGTWSSPAQEGKLYSPDSNSTVNVVPW